MAFKGGITSTHLGKGQDGFNHPSHVTSFKTEEGTMEVGREAIVPGGVTTPEGTGTRGKGKKGKR